MTEHQHYFTAEPVSGAELRERTVHLGGHDVQVQTAGGIFSPGGVDKGTAVLLRFVPAPPAEGTFLDLGCGWGALALTLALSSPQATVYAVDVNRRALDLTQRNAERLGCAVSVATEPGSTVPASTEPESATTQAGGPLSATESSGPMSGMVTAEPHDVPETVSFDLIWSNPPIRVGKQALHEMLSRWLGRLAPGGTAYLVVSKNLGADSLQTWLTTRFPHADIRRHATSKGFRVLAVHAQA